MQLSFTAGLDYMIGVVWSLQDVLATYNLRQCKQPNYALRYVLQCGCGDTPHRIPEPQRHQGVADGALWCVGTLSLLRTDGTTGIVYNPYTLDMLSAGVSDVTTYINCLSVHTDPAACAAPPSESTQLEQLVQQNADPIAVWGRCKSNYALSTWDVGAGALFVPPTSASAYSNVPAAAALAAIAWAGAISPELLDCLQDPALLQVDYSTCMRTFFSATRGQTPSAYFLYQPQQTNVTNGGAALPEPPDACLVFSGLRAAASPGSPLADLMRDCSVEEEVGQNPTACNLNPLVRARTRAHAHARARC